MTSPDSLLADVRDQLRTDLLGRALEGHTTIGSTNQRAAEWARAGAAEGSVVYADHQSAGRGRHGRAWTARPGVNLMLSIVLRPTLPADRLGLVTVAASLGVADAVDAFVGPHDVRIKWPNDVLLDGKKTCGMLLESSFRGTGTEPAFVVLGIGLNVNQIDFPDALQDRATSLRLSTGRTIPRAPLLARVLSDVETQYDRVLSGETASLIDTYEERLHNRGASVTLRMQNTDATVTGVVAGVTDTGALRLQTDDGERILHAGEVTSQPAR